MSKLEDILNSGIHFSKKDPYSTSHVARMYLACTSHLKERGFKRLNGGVSLAYFRLFCVFYDEKRVISKILYKFAPS